MNSFNIHIALFRFHNHNFKKFGIAKHLFAAAIYLFPAAIHLFADKKHLFAGIKYLFLGKKHLLFAEKHLFTITKHLFSATKHRFFLHLIRLKSLCRCLSTDKHILILGSNFIFKQSKNKQTHL